MLIERPLRCLWLAIPLLLAGCSGHPGAGTWQIEDGLEGGYSRLVVQFDGRAEFFRPGEETAAQRCFWAGESSNSIALQCSDAANPDLERHYRLKVNQRGQGELMQGGRLLGLLQRQQ
jgi:hypothetical protein